MNNITPGFIVLLIALCVAILSVKKEHAIVPIIIAMCFLPADISIKIADLDFHAVRVLALLSLFKIYFGYSTSVLKLNTIDKLFILYNLLGAIIYFIASENKFGAFLFRSGLFIDSVILYIVIRNIVQSREDINIVVKTFCICIILLLPFTIYEYFTANNLFSFLGRDSISFRDGMVRASGTFSHSILYGSFAVALIPILWASYKIQKTKTKIIALLSCIFIIYACSSSGPIVVFAGVIFFLCFFKWKKYSSQLFWLILIAATSIHFIREKPLWHLLYVRLSVRAGSTGWHRFMLTDAAVKEFWNWWLLGYGDIGPKWHIQYWPQNHARFTDITNQYLLEGVRGGFFTMLIFIILCYKVINILVSFSIAQKDESEQWLWWGFAVMMIAHCITFLSVAYFGQITMLLYLTVAIAAFAYDESKKSLVPS